jgi:hypothetical protein
LHGGIVVLVVKVLVVESALVVVESANLGEIEELRPHEEDEDVEGDGKLNSRRWPFRRSLGQRY